MKRKHEQILAVLEFLETGPKTLKDIALVMNQTKDCVRLWMCDLEHMGVVSSTFSPAVFRGNRARVIHLVDRTKYQMKERKQTKCRIKEAYDNEHYPLPKGGVIHRNLDKPERPYPLRKMNYGWMGYQSGLEAA